MDHLSFYIPTYSLLSSGNMHLVRDIHEFYVNVGIDLLKGSSLLHSFPLPPPKVPQAISIVSTIFNGPTDPWILPAPLDLQTYGE